MPAQRLSSVSCAVGQNTTAYFNGSDEAYIVAVNVCNIGNQACGFRMALTADITPVAGEWIEYDTEIMGKGVLEREGVVIGPGERIVVWSNTDLCSVNVFGFPIGTVTGSAPIVVNGDFSQPLDPNTNWFASNAGIVNGVLIMDGGGDASEVSQTLFGIATGLDYFYSFEVTETTPGGGDMAISSGPTIEIVNFTAPGVYSGTFTAGANTASMSFNIVLGVCGIDNVLVKRV